MQRLLLRLFIGILFALFGLVSYCTNVEKNPITGEVQRVSLSPRQEVVLGLKSRGQLAQQYGGLYPDPTLQNYVDEVGLRVVKQSAASQASYPFDFHLLRDPKTINAFALPGGQIFITLALFNRLNSEAQLAGVFGHEVGHVIARHGSEHLARQQLGVALVNAVGITASDNPQDAQQAAILAQAVNQLVNLRYGREDELESDRLGFQFMTQAGYNPKGLVELMQILASARSGGNPPEFLSTHPNPGNRVERLQAIITETYPNGIPANLDEGQERFGQIVGSR
ncbi:M48 family metallopeptidase [Planktothrix sp. FACHB-1365]|uniref:M48 family metallopeptidase n=1 Tax=Planktothrix sp. FACHB-1365 TaxID=2692855 RepID=UPI00168818DC|nr:M48 family metallopeptidase [Planktothrix sp. FACHB-1365]MBD2484682.1 M48 family metalloprotease [Planktothrix sp. FACHB-1365]